MKIGDRLDIPVMGSYEFDPPVHKALGTVFEIDLEASFGGLYDQFADHLYFDMRHGINYIEYENWQSNQKTGNVLL